MQVDKILILDLTVLGAGGKMDIDTLIVHCKIINPGRA
jgi:hypothetical protein